MTRADGAAERDAVAFLHRLVELRQSMCVGRCADHLGAEARAHLVHAGDVVGVVVRQQDQVEPASGVQRRDDRLRVRRIDDGNRPEPLSRSIQA